MTYPTPKLIDPPNELMTDLPGALLAALPDKVREYVSIRGMGEQIWEIGHPTDTRLRVTFVLTNEAITANTSTHAWADWLGHRLLLVIADRYKTPIEIEGCILEAPDLEVSWPTFESWIREKYKHAVAVFGDDLIRSTFADLPEDLRDVLPPPVDEGDDPGDILDSCAAQRTDPKVETKKKRRGR